MAIIFPQDLEDISPLSSKFQFSVEKCNAILICVYWMLPGWFSFFCFWKCLEFLFVLRVLNVYKEESWFKPFRVLSVLKYVCFKSGKISCVSSLIIFSVYSIYSVWSLSLSWMGSLYFYFFISYCSSFLFYYYFYELYQICNFQPF